MQSGKKIFRPRARIIKSLGDELISNEYVAISELVKNSYDAGSTFVKIDIQKDRIIISDNGQGMTIQQLHEGWFEPATNIKVKNKKLLGEKGIGRFSVVKLASELELRTKSRSNLGIISYFNWDDFNKENTYLDEIEIEWSEYEWKEKAETGTILILKKLKEDWGDISRIKKLKTFLSRMVSPFDEIKNFKICIKETEQDNFVEIETNDILKNPHYQVSGEIVADTIELNYTGIESANITLKKIIPINIFSCGDFKFEFRIWDRDSENITKLSEESGLKTNEIRDLLDEATGISIYRDNFRVLPYGEPNNDWLRLDLRRVNNPSMRLSNNQVIGYIRISKETNSNLKDKTNREGLIENDQYEDLLNKVYEIIQQIEEKRWVEREPKRKSISGRINNYDFIKSFSLKEVEDYAIKKYPADKTLANKIKKTNREIRDQGERFQKLILRYRRLSTLGQLLETVIHEINNSFATISTSLSTAINYAEDNTKVIDKINQIKDRQLYLQKFINRLKPFAERNGERSSWLNLRKEIENAIALEQNNLKENNIEVILPTREIKILMKKVDCFSIFTNLIDNSVYWLKESTPRDDRKILIVLDETETDIVIQFSDSGPGVEEEYRPYIFDPYFSRKKNGTGLGLCIIGEIVSDYGGTLEYFEDGDLNGAAFKITFKK